MASLSVTNTFSASTTAVASEVNTNFTDVVNYVNNRNSGSATWDVCSVLSTSTTVLVVDNSSGTNDIVNFKDGGTSVFRIADGGATLIKGQVQITDDATDSFIYGGVTRGTGQFKFVASGGSVGIQIAQGTGVHMPSASAGLQVGASPTGGDKGAGTINTGSSIWVNGQIRLHDDGTDSFIYGGATRGTGLVKLVATGGGVAANISSLASFIVGSAALNTNATDGFLYIPSCAGTPTGTPTSFTGRFPLVIDSTNHKLYFYDGSWRDVGP